MIEHEEYTYRVEKSKLEGIIEVSGAKNSALRLLAASILTKHRVLLRNVPNGILDFNVHVDMLSVLGKKIEKKHDYIVIEEDNIISDLIWDGRAIRNTLLILGALVSRTGKGRVPLPGGCQIGNRKIDFHIMILEKLGAKVWEENGYLCAEATEGRLKGNTIILPFRSVGATENFILCSVLAKGKSTLINPNIQPELFDLIKLLNSIGANIEVFGTEKIEVTGVDELGSGALTVMSDDIEAITWLIAAMVTKGEVEIKNFPYDRTIIAIEHLKNMGANIYKQDTSIIVKDSKCYPFEITANAFPNIKSDMQPLFAPIGVVANGRSVIRDTRYPERFKYAVDLNNMHANIEIFDGLIVIEGGKTLHGTDVFSHDLRAGAGLVLSGLISEGQTNVKNAWQIERGYENFVMKLKNVGATIDIINNKIL